MTGKKCSPCGPVTRLPLAFLRNRAPRPRRMSRLGTLMGGFFGSNRSGDLAHLARRQRGQTDPGKFVIDPEILVGTGRIAEKIQYRALIGAIRRLMRHASNDVGLQCGVGIACRIYSGAETAGVGLAVAARRTIKILLKSADVGERVEAGR